MLCCGPTHFQYTRFGKYAEVPIRTVPVYIDTQFDQEDLLHIDDAVMRWNYALNGYIVLRVISYESSFTTTELSDVKAQHGLIIRKVTSDYPWIPINPNPQLHIIAWANLLGGTEIYLVRNRMLTEDIFPIMLHELAHIMGAHHLISNNLMNPTYTKENYQCIDEYTVRQVASFNHINPGYLNYCLWCND